MKSEEITEYCTSTVIPNMKVSVSIVLEGKDCSSMSRQVPSSGDGTPSIEGLAALGCRLEGSSSIEERGMDVKRIDGICSGVPDLALLRRHLESLVSICSFRVKWGLGRMASLHSRGLDWISWKEQMLGATNSVMEYLETSLSDSK
jgi:hypothetical protein